MAERARTEETAPLAWFRGQPGPWLTLRGKWASAFVGDDVPAIFEGRVEEAFAFWGPSPRQKWGLLTWCSIRVHRVWKGDVAAGETVTLLYHGGTLENGYREDRAHEVSCSVGATGLFATSNLEGLDVPNTELTTTFPNDDARPALESLLNSFVNATLSGSRR